jgi:hypothetical protein
VIDLLTAFGRTLGFSFTAGINLYATIATLGLASRYGWVDLPDHYRVFDNDLVIGAAIVLYIVEFLADKIPWVDTLWDALHTFIRPVGGALVALGTLGDASPAVEALTALAGGTLAAGTHFAKAGTRAAVNASPEPFSNWALSTAEDVFVVGLGLVALRYPLVAALVVVAGVVLMLVFAAWIVRAVRRRWRWRRPAAGAGA